MTRVQEVMSGTKEEAAFEAAEEEWRTAKLALEAAQVKKKAAWIAYKLMVEARENRQSGIALFIAMMALVLVSAIALAMVLASGTETAIAANYRDSIQAHYAADSGFREAQDRMRRAAVDSLWSQLPTGLPGAGPADVLYLLNTGVASPVAGKPTAQASTSYAFSQVAKWNWVKIALKQNGPGKLSVDGAGGPGRICWDGHGQHVRPGACLAQEQPVYDVTAYAIGPLGSVSLQNYEVSGAMAAFAMPAALTVVDYPGDLTAGNTGINTAGAWVLSEPGNQFYIDGTDPAGCLANQSVPAVGLADNSGRSITTSQWTGVAPKTPPANLTGGIADVHVALQAITDSQGHTLDTVFGLNGIVSDIYSLPKYDPVLNPDALVNIVSDCSNLPAAMGTPAHPLITVVQGSCLLPPLTPTGAYFGMLVVDGQIDYQCDNCYQGIILGIGTGRFNAAANAHFTGAMLLGQTRDPYTGAPLSTPGMPQFDWLPPVTALKPAIQYDSCLVGQAAGLMRPDGFKQLVRRDVRP